MLLQAILQQIHEALSKSLVKAAVSAGCQFSKLPVHFAASDPLLPLRVTTLARLLSFPLS